MNNKVVTFVGAGNMTRSLIAGLIQNNSELHLNVADPAASQLDHIVKNWQNITIFTDNVTACAHADVIILAVKPDIIPNVCESLKECVQHSRALVISIAAGVREASINQALGEDVAIVRCMPNTPALVQAGATGLYANEHVSATQRDWAEVILRAVGITLWFADESQLDTVTAVSGSGPAYFFLVMEAMQSAAIRLGLSHDDARLLVLQTAMGAAKLALESSDDVGTLRERVTSKGGTTEAAVKALNDGGLNELFLEALTAAKQRSVTLASS